MADPKGFLKLKRESGSYRPVEERLKDYREVSVSRSPDLSVDQASRCMDCGTPFCHWACPIANYIPEWNDLVFNKKWDKAFEMLSNMNNFPEFTGRLCPALCEYSCVLGINDDPVTIRENELAIIEYAFSNNLVPAVKPSAKTGKKVAVIGSGPAGLACADQLNKAGHEVTVYEKDRNPGGILRYGIPDFKLDKKIVERRINLMKQSGVKFEAGVNAGVDVRAEELMNKFDAMVICAGSRTPRDMKIEGRELKGVYFAMDYLMQSNRRVSGEKIESEIIDAAGKNVVVIGGGDTGSDCVGTARRQGANSVVQLELLPCPPETRSKDYPWPFYPVLLKTTSSHEEGCNRQWSVSTKKFLGKNGKLTGLSCVKVDFSQRYANNRPVMKEVPGSEFEIAADMVVLAMGFVGPEKIGMISGLQLELDVRGNIRADADFMTSKKGVFAAGDARRGQSLIVWAISEGRKAAQNVDKFLMGKTRLPSV
ncbi:MAG TPA: glutamate synthase [Elusimicrobia bacterium]|nr:MAG: glutamate synthase [Elusimicrobia bacterium RIFOXYA12_FULL_49_49]OGS06868.1 MAG: glutamate synthase [Elusimicrobia bacterium RIFOXYA1_FULL_47_7]OGS10286.1 MAG: glutamate synthase [Elusimicrobia bacterium RIFOXYB1_FULL_48_9]OGS15019.1 MAG: glutamate synthase [Elusimicrobia bacterium RIFOXYA2_FULL_47_53]OGS26156.1 MAG: glutamate synthase [Elusimicrobia bacterium RIFOXYB12_FULL_50_12]OGS29364.1 MAG: glutamate synthase [Elusimicrobia bacterium RIFOXYB2_FULL_46_23]HBU70298.1 glutamate synt